MSDERPLPCPRCGRQPKRRSVFTYGTSYSDGSRITYWYECRRWFGLRLCCRSESHTNFKDWSDIARLEALRKWNASVKAFNAARDSVSG